MFTVLLAIVLAQAMPSPSPAASATPGNLTLSPASVNMNPAQQQVVGIAGATPPLTLVLDRKLVDAVADPAGSGVTITATQATGSDVLHVTDANGATADLPIRVAFNAGTIVPQTALVVTGNPAQPDWIAEQVASLVARLTQAMPGAQTTIGAVTPPASALAPGQTTAFTIPVQIAGNGQYFDQTGSTTVTVQNEATPPFLPGLLFYDDDPEHVAQDGVLFRATVTAGQPARLYYYHDAAQDPRRLVVAIRGTGDAPASVQLVEASAGPNIDVMQVGQSVTKRFLLTKANGEGVIANIAPGNPYLLADVPMSARQLVAGTVDLNVLSGGPVSVTVLGVSPGVDPRTLFDAPVLPGDGHHRTGVFSIAAFGTQNLSYTAGSDDATAVLGDTDPTPQNVDASAGGHDYGDYGVIHTIDLTLNNSTAAPAAAYLFMQPLAGPARGSFVVDGNVVDVGCVRVPSRYQVMAFQLAPGQTSHAVVQTMTDGGSFYPVRVGVTATPPIPSAPPINAPDGCFPKATPAPTQ